MPPFLPFYLYRSVSLPSPNPTLPPPCPLHLPTKELRVGLKPLFLFLDPPSRPFPPHISMTPPRSARPHLSFYLFPPPPNENALTSPLLAAPPPPHSPSSSSYTSTHPAPSSNSLAKGRQHITCFLCRTQHARLQVNFPHLGQQ